MKKALSLRLLEYCLVSASLLIAASTVAVRKHTSGHNSIKSVIVSSSGQRLTTLFDGLPHDPRYSLKDILATRSALPKCGKKPSVLESGEKPGVLKGLSGALQSFFGSAVVYACRNTDCTGNNWVQIIDSCNTGGPCSGDYNNVTNDGMSDNGFAEVNSYCGDAPECGCEIFTC